MKNLNILAGAIAIAAASPVAFAHMDYFNDPYLGVNVIQTNQKFKKGLGANTFKKNPVNVGVYGGFKFTNHFGVEAGWEQQLKKSRTYSITQEEEGELDVIGGKTTFKGRHPYLGVFGEYKHHAWRFQALLAASVSQIKTRNQVTSFNGDAADALKISKKNKIVPMVKLTGMYNFTENFGVSLVGTYRNTSRFGFNVDDVKLKDTFGLGLGLTYFFC